MTVWRLAFRSLWFYRRTQLWVAVGAALATMILAGALYLGVSLRQTLRDLVTLRLGRTEWVLGDGSRLLRTRLVEKMTQEAALDAAPVLLLRAAANRPDQAVAVNRVQFMGVDSRFWQLSEHAPRLPEAGQVVLNRALAERLQARPGDDLVVRVTRPGFLPLEAPLSREEDTVVVLRLTVAAVAADAEFGRFNLAAVQVAPLNAFVDLVWLQEKLQLTGYANVVLLADGGAGNTEVTEEALRTVLRKHWELEDVGLELRALAEQNAFELRSRRLFLEPQIGAAVGQAFPAATGYLTYFINDIRAGVQSIPYSMVTAAGRLGVPPVGSPVCQLPFPGTVKPNEIVLNDWAAADLGVQAGAEVKLSYFVPGPGRRLETRDAGFRVGAVVPRQGAAADPSLMPEFPGLAGTVNCRDWSAGVPVDFSKIRPQDQEYWERWQGTPKAFLDLAAGRELWQNRFGNLTAIRLPLLPGTGSKLRDILRTQLDPAELGLAFFPVRRQALAAGAQGVDFGWLFLGFSSFLLAAAVVLAALLHAFNREQRLPETGTLLAVGFTRRQCQRLLALESLLLALLGAVPGAIAGRFYAQILLWGLATVWRDAAGGLPTQAVIVDSATLTWAVAGGVLAAFLGLWLGTRQTGAAIRDLLSGDAVNRRFAGLQQRRRWAALTWAGALLFGAALLILMVAGANGERQAAPFFFAGGALLLFSLLLLAAAVLLGPWRRSYRDKPLTLVRLAAGNSSRRLGRSLAVIFILSCGVFLVVTVGASRKTPDTLVADQAGGTGGFALIGDSALGILQNVNSVHGRAVWEMDTPEWRGIRMVSCRWREGDDASCLNLNRAQQPDLLGVPVAELGSRGAFSFHKVLHGLPPDWTLLRKPLRDGTIPVVADETTVIWGLGRKLGDTVAYRDSQGHPVTLRIAGIIGDSVLQGKLLLAEDQFLRLFPDTAGYRFFLVEVPEGRLDRTTRELSGKFQNYGLALQPTLARWAEFHNVENTYLAIFAALGGLGLLLGTAGLGVVVWYTIFERRSELALLRAVGFTRRRVQWLIVLEHGFLLFLGLGIGLLSALVAVLPMVHGGAAFFPWRGVLLLTTGIAGSGLLWCLLAAGVALRAPLVNALRQE